MSGIPQGSVLGPMLFVIFINDLPECILVDAFSFLFADDTKMFRNIKTIEECRILQKDIDSLYKWSKIWLIDFNSDMCKHMHIGKSDFRYRYTLNGIPLKYTEVEKDIGVHIDDQLSFDVHIATKCKKANSMFALIRRTFKFLNENIFMCLYKSMVRSHLDSCSSIWAPYKSKQINAIESVQRRATKQVPSLRDPRMIKDSRN